MARQNISKADRKSDVLTAAASLFAERGYAAVGIDEIGDHVGVTGPAIYNHFDCKEALLAAVILNAAEGLARVAESTTASRSSDPHMALRELVNATAKATLDLGGAAVVYIHEMRRLGAKDRRAVRRADQRLLGVARQLVFSVVPGLSEESFILRSVLVAGAVTAIAGQRAVLPRRAIEMVMGAAAFDVLQAPALTVAGNSPNAISKSANWLPPSSRRDEILTAAARLFAERSFHDVSMDDIGAAAGISAPAIYRHFSSKADILSEAFYRVGSRMIVGTERALREASTPSEALENLVRSLVGVALETSDLLVVVAQRFRELGSEDVARERRTRQQLLDTWAHVIGANRPDLGEPHARVLAHAGVGAITQAAQLPETAASGVEELTRLTLTLLRS